MAGAGLQFEKETQSLSKLRSQPWRVGPEGDSAPRTQGTGQLRLTLAPALPPSWSLFIQCHCEAPVRQESRTRLGLGVAVQGTERVGCPGSSQASNRREKNPGQGARTMTLAGHSDPRVPFCYNALPFPEELCDLVLGLEDQLVLSILPHHPAQRSSTGILNPFRDGNLITYQGSFLFHFRQH